MENFLFIVLLSVLASAKVLIQAKSSRKIITGTADSFFFNSCVFLVVALGAAFGLHGKIGSPVTVLLGSAFGIVSVVFQFAYNVAMKNGPVSLTNMSSNASVILPVVFCMAAYGERPSLFGIAGLFCLFLSLVFVFVLPEINKKRPAKNYENPDGSNAVVDRKIDRQRSFEQKGNGFSGKWLVFLAVLFISCGALNIIQKIHAHTSYKNEYFGFVYVAYVTASFCSAAVSLCFYAISKLTKNLSLAQKTSLSFKPTVKTLFPAAAIGALLCAFQVLMQYVSGIIHGVVLFPVYNALVTVIVSLAGRLFFKDELDKFRIIGVALGLVASVLIAL